MAIRVFNSFSGKKEEFKPLNEGFVKMYACGVTVYDHCHIGHARSAIVFDVIYRYFMDRGYDVTYVRNFTDIDDKIINKSHIEGIAWDEVGKKYIKSFYEDMDAMNILRPTHEPRATEHIEEMVSLVEALVKNGHAYAVDGDVYFSVESFRGYGTLSKRTLEEMEAGARIGIDERKRNPLDFALWKSSKEGEPYWVTPFGEGRPGWHIECSAMSTKYLGNPFDIHGGGKDLIFPHHENERAQSEAATGVKFVNYWIHNGFVNIDKEKMSKSLGNFLLIKDFIKDYHPEVLRLFFLSNHYRSPVDYSDKSIEDSNTALYRLYYTLERVLELETANQGVEPQQYKETDEHEKLFFEAMDDDFNAALALSHVFELSKLINKLLDKNDKRNIPFIIYTKHVMLHLANILGMLSDDFKGFEAKEKSRHLERMGLTAHEIENMIQERVAARKNKDFKKADEFRDTLLKKGILLLDTPKGTEWRTKHIFTLKGEG